MISPPLGHDQYPSVAQARKTGPVGEKDAGMDSAVLRDEDWERNTGNGWAQNHVLPIAPDYTSGQQAFNSVYNAPSRRGASTERLQWPRTD